MNSAAILIGSFRWFRPEAGFRWVHSNDGSRLAPKEWDRMRGVYGEWYAPQPWLFREFARIRYKQGDDESSEIRRFADKYGDILSRQDDTRFASKSNASTGRIWYEAVRNTADVQTWRNAITRMRSSVAVWDRIRAHAERPRDQQLLNELIRHGLTDTETPSVATPILRAGGLVLLPQNLLAFMWLSFARVVSGEVQERLCTGFDEAGDPCPNHVYIGPGVRRDDARATCSALCRKRKQRPKNG